MTRKAIFLLCLFLIAPAPAQVTHRDEISQQIRLEVGPDQAFLVFAFRSRSRRPLSLRLPAGMRFHGTVEPCLPVLLGRDLEVRLAPAEQKTYRVEALSLYFFAHTPGLYEASFPSSDERRLVQRIQRVWKLHQAGQLRHSPLRISQAVAYTESGADPAKLKQTFSAAELSEATGASR